MLLKVYVDDTGLVTEELPPGSRFKDGKITIMEEFIEEDKEVPGDLRTAKIITEIASCFTSYQ